MKGIFKKLTAAALATTFVVSGAYASKARLEALGQSEDGSRLISDSRNVFLNPASLLGGKSFVALELGQDDDAADAQGTPKAEGGIFRVSDGSAWGLYFGHENEEMIDDMGALTSAVGYLKPDNTLNLFYAMDTGIKWGAGLAYSTNSAKPNNAASNTKETSMMELTAGVDGGSYSFDVKFGFSGEGSVKASGQAEDEVISVDSNMAFGGHFDVADYRLMVGYSKFETTHDDNTTLNTNGESNAKTSMSFTVGQETKAGGATVWYSAGYSSVEDKETKTVSSDTVTSTTTGFPLSVGVESAATSWLTLRGSVSTTFMGKVKSEDSATPDNGSEDAQTDQTDVIVGGSLTFGDLVLDGLVGGSLSGNVGTQNGTLNSESFMTRVSVNYSF